MHAMLNLIGYENLEKGVERGLGDISYNYIQNLYIGEHHVDAFPIALSSFRHFLICSF